MHYKCKFYKTRQSILGFDFKTKLRESLKNLRPTGDSPETDPTSFR